MPDARDLARMLAARIDRLVLELLPAGRRHGQEWRCGSVGNEPGQSLGVHLHGVRAGVWADFATGECGDALDLVAAVLHRGNRGQAIAWAKRWLGLGGAAPEPVQQRRASPPVQHQDDVEQRRRKALVLFLAAQESLAGTPAAAYLAARGIDLAELGRQPRALRFHPRLWHPPSGLSFPALVAAVSGPDGQHQGTHRTWLEHAGGGWIKARVESPKMSLGPVSGGAVRLWRGSSGKPLRDAPADDVIVLAEGIETALSVVVARPELRVLAAISLANLGSVALPSQVSQIVIAADNDTKPAARRGLRRAIEQHQAAGREVRLARPPSGLKDFNDVLTSPEAV